MLLSLLLRGVGMGGSAQASAPSLGLPHIIISLDPDDAEYPEGFALFFRPPWPETEPASGAVGQTVILEIDRDPEDTPRSRRIVEVVKQNFDFVDTKVEVLASLPPHGLTQSVFTDPGEHMWTCPPNVTSVNVKCFGKGGKGWQAVSPSVSSINGVYVGTTGIGAGGGGGGYAEDDIPVTAGTTYRLKIEDPEVPSDIEYSGGFVLGTFLSESVSEFRGDDGRYVQATAGSSALGQLGKGRGGRGVVGSILSDGGDATTVSLSAGGGGGGAGGPTGDGADGGAAVQVVLYVTGGTGGAGGGGNAGDGGNGGDSSFNSAGDVLLSTPGEAGENYGGGGGGSGSGGSDGTNPDGGLGAVIITWTVQQFADGDYGDITIADDVMAIDASAVTTAKINNLAVTTGKIDDLAVTEGKLAAGAVTEAKQTLADNTTNDVTSTKHGYAPKSPGDATKFLNGAATPAYALVKDSDLSTTDITTNDATSAKHGFLPKLSNVDRNVLSGDGLWQARGTIILEDQQSSGTYGGTFTTGAWRTRVLNTEVADTNGDCTLASNQFTLVAGTYEIEASAPAGAVNRHQIRLQNITDAATTAMGSSEFNLAASSIQTRSVLRTRFTIAGSKVFEIQHQCETTCATVGLGVATSFGGEIYAQVFIRRVK